VGFLFCQVVFLAIFAIIGFLLIGLGFQDFFLKIKFLLRGKKKSASPVTRVETTPKPIKM
jgi:hypothetical protein